jgi:hypothetical protein
LIAANRADQAMAVLRETQASGALTRALRVHAANLEAGIHFRAGRIAEAQAALDKALADATDDSDERFAKVSLRALRDEATQKSLGRAYFGDERGRPLDPALVIFLITEFARQFPDEALGPYLIGKQLFARDPKLALPYFADACPISEAKKVPLDATFTKECRRQLGESAYLAGELSLSREAFAWLADHANYDVDRARARDYLQRIAWKNSR